MAVVVVVQSHLLSLSIIILSILSSSLALSQNPSPRSAYEELQSSGFPVGLLPTNVLSYTLNRTSGEFTLSLDDRCHVILPPDNYLAAYAPLIKGNLAAGRISSLDGIRVKAMFRWWSITGIRSAGDDVVFEVGVASAKYPAKNFDASPQCEGSGKASS